MNFDDLKQKIYDEEKIEFILEALGCHSISNEQNGGLYTAALPEGNNKRSVQIRNNIHLNSSIRSKGIKGNIFTVVKYIKNYNDNQAKNWIEKICKYDGFTVLKKEHPLQWLKDLKKKRRGEFYYDDLEIYDECLLDNYLDFAHYKFAKDGISSETQEEFDVCYDPVNNRIIIPIRDLKGNLVGLKARNLDEYDLKNNMKYIYVLNAYQSQLLFNYHRALQHIIECGFIIVGEAEKLPMQLYDMGIYNSVSLGCSDPSPTQLKILRNLSVPVVLAYDKGIKLEFIKEKYEKLGLYRTIYVVYDSENILDSNKKESPTDKGIEVWNYLFNRKIKIY